MAGDKCAGAITGCELCGGAAAVHCAADSAFLCAACDAKVHGANFLASRHVRRRLHDGQSAPGSATDSDSDSSSSCVSTADSYSAAAPAVMKGRRTGGGRKKQQQQRARAEAVLEGWAKRMGLARGAARRRAASATRALRALGRSRVPLRVAMAAALWSEVAGSGCEEAALLRRLEASAHVPARMVLAVAAWMARAAGRAAAPAEEGWAECS